MAEIFLKAMVILLGLSCCCLFALGSACVNLNATDCKVQIGKQLEQELIGANIEVYEKALNRYIEFYASVLRDLPKNSVIEPVLKKTINKIKGRLRKMQKNRSIEAEKLKKALRNLDASVLPDYKGIKFNEELDEILEMLFERYQHERVKEYYLYGSKDEIADKSTEIWHTFYARLRPIDLSTFWKYSNLNEKFKILTDLKTNVGDNVRPLYFKNTMIEIVKFFDMTILKVLYKKCSLLDGVC